MLNLNWQYQYELKILKNNLFPNFLHGTIVMSTTLYPDFGFENESVLGEMADSRSGAGKAQRQFGTFYDARKQRITRRLVGSCQKDTDAGFKETPSGYI